MPQTARTWGGYSIRISISIYHKQPHSSFGTTQPEITTIFNCFYTVKCTWKAQLVIHNVHCFFKRSRRISCAIYPMLQVMLIVILCMHLRNSFWHGVQTYTNRWNHHFCIFCVIVHKIVCITDYNNNVDVTYNKIGLISKS